MMSSQVQTPEDSKLFPLMVETYASPVVFTFLTWLIVFFHSQHPFRSLATDGAEASVEPDAIEDIFRLFIIEEVKHDAGAGPPSAEQLRANPDRSNASYGNKTESLSEQRMDAESAACRGQKQLTTKEMLGDSHHRIRQPWSG